MCIEPKINKKNWIVRLITGRRIGGITLAPFGIYLREDIYKRMLYDAVVPKTINHEKIHWQQQLELLIIFFYFIYFAEWFIRIFTNFGNAYYSISFEREAFANDRNEDYLKTRKPFSWLKYMFKSQ